MELNRLNFGSEELEKNISNFYTELYNKELKKVIDISSKTEFNFLKNSFFLIEDIPNYIETHINDSVKGIKSKTINTYSGSLINLSKYNTLNEYLNHELSSRRKYEIKKSQRRLDLCFNPIYKMYYGEINKEVYDSLFKDYKYMLLRRLDEKKAYWEELDYWEERYNSSYERIINKEACIFVIYNKEKPISIYICSVFKSTVFAEVVAYDIDYSKFKIGFLVLIKIIEWAIINNFELIDLSKGDFYYKERFRNGVYIFQNQIIYDSSNTQIVIKANMLAFKLNLIYKLLPVIKKWKIYGILKAIKSSKKMKLFNEVLPKLNISNQLVKNYEIQSEDILKIVNINDGNYDFLKKEFNDFLFLNSENADDTLISKLENSKNTYIFKGKKSTQKLMFDL